MTQHDIYSSLSIFNYSHNKICDLYDSQHDISGQAYDITREINVQDGVKKLEFSIPYKLGKKKNFRWDFLKNEYLVRLIYKNKTEWYIAQKPVKHKDTGGVYGVVTCAGIESTLKTKNIYMEFDDENGIGTISYLADKILAGTGWHRGHTDPMLEQDGETEKVRSMTSTNKQGALAMIQTLCNLFKAYPVFNSENKTVEFYNFNNRDMVIEGTVGTNMESLSATYDSSDICTRLYVEGEYADSGYIGIDSVNPTGLNFILNFDYYKEIGAFTEEHEAIVQQYLEDLLAAKSNVSSNMSEIFEKEDDINALIGQCRVAVYYIAYGYETPVYEYGVMTDDEKALHPGDEVVVLNRDGTFRYVTVASPLSVPTITGDYGVAKFVSKASGSIGAAEIQIEAKQKEIENLERQIASSAKPDKIAQYQAKIYELQDEIKYIYLGSGANQTLMNTLYPKYVPSGYIGNVNLFNRKIVAARHIIPIYPEFDKKYSTLNPYTDYQRVNVEYVSIYDSGSHSYTYDEKAVYVICTVASIRQNGSVFPNAKQYARHLCSQAKTIRKLNNIISGIKAYDNQQYGMLLNVRVVEEDEIEAALQEEKGWVNTLVAYQEQWDNTRARYNWFGYINMDIDKVFGEKSGTVEGLYSMMDRLMRSDGLMHQLDALETASTTINNRMDEIESAFIAAMGDMLRDGYWSNNNYVQGQEQHLYDDAVERMKLMSRPSVAYQFDVIRLHKEFGIPLDDFKLNAMFRIHDDELEINDNLFVSKISLGIDDESKGKVDITNKDISISTNDLGALLSRMSQLADLIEQKNTLYDRAKAISQNGSILSNRLNGQIDVLKNQLMSTVSNWHTDERGNIIFLSADESSAMMLCGSGFMIANSKDDNNEWNWRTFGTGEGFTADEIIAGFISADRIEAGTISVDKVEAGFGGSLVLSGNPSINALNSQIAPAFEEDHEYTAGQYVNYNGVFYIFTTDFAGGTFEQAFPHLMETNVASQIELMPDRIIQYVGSLNYGKTYIQDSDPALDPSIELHAGDMWFKPIDGTKWSTIKLSTWQAVKNPGAQAFVPNQAYSAGDFVKYEAAQASLDLLDLSRNTGLSMEERAQSMTILSQAIDVDYMFVSDFAGGTFLQAFPYLVEKSPANNKWSKFKGSQQMYCWDGSKWLLVYDNNVIVEAYTKIDQNSYAITLEASRAIAAENQKYTIRSGIDIKAEGIEISGSKYVKIKSGGEFTVESGAALNITSIYQRYDYDLEAYVNDTRLDIKNDGTFLELGNNQLWPSLSLYDYNRTRYDMVLDRYGAFHTTGSVNLWKNGIGLSNETHISMIYGAIYLENGARIFENSSRDIKHDINPVPSMGSIIDLLEPVTFIYDGDSEEKTQYGLIYEDTIDILPDICTNTEDKKAINYNALIPILLNEIKDLRERVRVLEEREEQ